MVLFLIVLFAYCITCLGAFMRLFWPFVKRQFTVTLHLEIVHGYKYAKYVSDQKLPHVLGEKLLNFIDFFHQIVNIGVGAVDYHLRVGYYK